MYDFTFAWRMAIAAVSFAGYAMFLTKRWGIHPLIAPAVVIPSLGVAMVAAGMLNTMLVTVYVLAGLGVALFIYTLIINKGAHGLLHPAHAIVLAALGWMLWKLQGTQVYSIDNFHHWLKVLSVLVTHDALPSYRTPAITFQAYPTGSASYLYYMLKLVRYREDMAVIFQLMMMAVFCLPLFALPKKGKPLAWIVLAGSVAVMLSRLYERDTMLVDDLQAYIGLSAIAIAWYYRNDLNKALLCLAPTSAFTVLIKNSAFYFVAMTTVFLLVVLQDKQRWGRLKVVFYNFLLPALVFYLWTRHVSLVFDGGLGKAMEAKHALNLSAYYSQAKAWGLSRLPELTDRVFETAFSKQYFPGLLALLSTVAAALLTVPLWLSGKVKPAVRSLLLLVFAWLGYVMWELGNVGMFAFSMPWDETDMLACAERYMMTGIVYMFGLMVLSVVESVNEWPLMTDVRRKVGATVLALACAYVPLHYSGFPGEWGAPVRSKDVRGYFRDLKNAYPYDFGEAGIFITDEANMYYMIDKYMQTDFLVEKTLVMSTAEMENLDDIARYAEELAPEYTFLIIDTENEQVIDGLAIAMDRGAFYHMKVFLGMDEILQ